MARRYFLLFLLLGSFTATAHAEAWRFIVSGDSRSGTNSGGVTQVNTTIVTELGNAAVAEGAAFILVPGDLVYSGTNAADNAAAFTAWKNAITLNGSGLNINQIYPVMGNHDFYNSSTSGSDGAFKAAFNYLPSDGPTGVEQGRTYSFTYNNALILGLDEYATSYQVNQAWLDAQLSAPGRAPHLFAFGHLPAFQVSLHHTDTLDDHPDARNAFWTSLANAGARVYFAGHEHFYDRTRLDDGDGNPDNDLLQLVAGGGGAPLTTNSVSYDLTNALPYTPVNMYHDAQYGYLLVDVNGNDVSMTWKYRTGADTYAVGDSFNYTAVPEPATWGLLVVAAAFAVLWRTRFASPLRCRTAR